MSQIKIYGLREQLFGIRTELSDVLHGCIIEAFQYPQNKRAHRFFYLDEGDWYSPEGRSNQYTILEILLFEGRSVQAKKQLYQLIFERFERELGIHPNDVEIMITESPRHNWGIRGKAGDELELNYKVAI